MILSGHEDSVFTVKFDPTGEHLASAGRDKRILLWNVFGDAENYAMLEGHKNAIVELHWMEGGSSLVTASADKSAIVWDATTGSSVRRYAGHGDFVNSVCPTARGEPLFATGGDDGTVRVWDARSKRGVARFNVPDELPVTAVAFGMDGDRVFSGSVDNTIREWDIRKGGAGSLELEGHEDSIAGLALSPDGKTLLSNGMDSTVRAWDVRPFTAGERCVRVFRGATHNMEKLLIKPSWSADGSRVGSGSSDRCSVVWKFETGELMYKLPGHKGSCNEVTFHPKEPILASASSDKSVLMGELAPTAAV
jgi:Prp8 binding protein